MKSLLTTIIVILTLVSVKGQLSPDTSKYVIFDDKNSILRSFDKSCKPARLTDSEIMQIEKLTAYCVDKYNKDQLKYYNKQSKKEKITDDIEQHILMLDKFKWQIVPVINARGDKEVWVNCFRPFTNYKFPYWRQKIVFVNDGGNYFFNIKINLTKRKCFNLSVNGVA